MKKILKFLSIALLIWVILFTGAYFFVKTQGKKIFVLKASEALKKPVEIKSISVIFPLGLSIHDLNIKDYGYIKEAQIGFGVFYLFSNYFTFSSLVLSEPHIVVHRTKEGKIVLGELPKEENVLSQNPSDASSDTPKKIIDQTSDRASPQTNTQVKVQPAKSIVRFAFNKLIIRDGTISFFDHFSKEEMISIALNRVNLKTRDISFPARDGETKFIFNGQLKGLEDSSLNGGKIESRGWLNLVKKDMKGEFNIENLDGKIFSKYFGGQSMGKSIKNMSVNLSADLQSTNNDMTVKGKVTINSVILQTKEKKEKPSFEDLLLGGLQSMTKGLSLEFNFKTKMDTFKIDSFSFSGNIFG